MHNMRRESEWRTTFERLLVTLEPTHALGTDQYLPRPPGPRQGQGRSQLYIGLAGGPIYSLTKTQCFF